jgi:hypothetical protein
MCVGWTTIPTFFVNFIAVVCARTFTCPSYGKKTANLRHKKAAAVLILRSYNRYGRLVDVFLRQAESAYTAKRKAGSGLKLYCEYIGRSSWRIFRIIAWFLSGAMRRGSTGGQQTHLVQFGVYLAAPPGGSKTFRFIRMTIAKTGVSLFLTLFRSRLLE